jgi:hypothetical protein
MSLDKRISLTWLALVLVLLAVASSRAIAAEHQPLPFLMAEDFEDLDFCAWRIEPGQPDAHNPLVEPARPWDAGGVLAHGTVLRDPIDGLWKAWQHSIPTPAGKPDKQDSRWWAPRLNGRTGRPTAFGPWSALMAATPKARRRRDGRTSPASSSWSTPRAGRAARFVSSCSTGRHEPCRGLPPLTVRQWRATITP